MKKSAVAKTMMPEHHMAGGQAINLSIQISLPFVGPKAPPPPSVPLVVAKDAFKNKVQSMTPIRKKSSVAKMNENIYPEPTATMPEESPKGIAPKARPGYYH